MTDWYPDWTVHPGEILRETLDERGMTQAALAAKLGVTQPAVNHIITGERGIGVQTALKLEEALGVSAQLWMNLQTGYDLHHARKARPVPRVDSWQRLYALVRAPRPSHAGCLLAPDDPIVAWVHEVGDVIFNLIQSTTMPSPAAVVLASRVAANILSTGGLSPEADDEAIRSWLIAEVTRLAAP